MATVLDEILIKLGVDAEQAKAASAHVAELVKEIDEVPKHSESAFGAAAEHAKKLGKELKNVAGETAKFTKELLTVPFDAFEWINKGVEALDKTAKAARAAGIEVESFQRFQFLAQQSGIGVSTISGAVTKLNKLLIDASFQGQKAIQTLSLLGLTQKDLRGIGAEEQFALIADRLKLIDDQALKTTIQLKLFGKSGTQLSSLLAEGGDDIRKTLAQASVFDKDTAKKAEELDDSVGLIKNQIGSFKIAILTQAIPATFEITEAINGWLMANKAWINARLGEAVKLVAHNVEALLPLAKEAAADFGNWVKQNHELLKTRLPEFLKEVGESIAYAGRFGKEFVAIISEIPGIARDIDRFLKPAFVNAAEDAERLANSVKKIKIERDALDTKQLKKQSGVLLPALPRTLQEEDVNRAQDNLEILKDEKEARIKRKQLAALKKAEAGKPKKVKEVKSGVTLQEVLDETQLSGTLSQEKVKGLAAQTPSTKDVKPTVAIDYFIFNIQQTITTSDSIKAGQESVSLLKSEFNRATARNVPLNNVVR
jgi:hypothetical protein